jgi:hypothetical protein
MSLSATAVIHAAPKAISMVTSAAVATAQDALLSMEEDDDCNIKGVRPGILLTGCTEFDQRPGRAAALPAALRQNARERRQLKFPSRTHGNNEIDREAARYRFASVSALCVAPGKPI